MPSMEISSTSNSSNSNDWTASVESSVTSSLIGFSMWRTLAGELDEFDSVARP